MIVTPWFSFAAPPRCGTTWFTWLLQREGIEVQGGKNGSDKHHSGHEDGLPSITIRRNPADWLLSYYLLNPNRVGVPEIDLFNTLRHSTASLSEFVVRYILEHPGKIETMFRLFRSTHTVDMCGMCTTFESLLPKLGMKLDINPMYYKVVNATHTRGSLTNYERWAIEAAA